MGHNRFYLRPIKDGHAEIEGHEAHHLRRVRRVAVGEAVELFDGLGRLAKAKVTSVEPNKIGLDIECIEEFQTRKNGRIIIAASLAKGDRFELLVSKCTELGADHICPILFKRTVKLARGKSLMERYEKLVITAAKQSGRPLLPLINSPMEFPDSVKFLSETYPKSHWLIGSLDGGAPYLLDLPQDEQDTVVFVGPEGDMTTEETQVLHDRKARSVRLVDAVLRVETAAMAFVTILAARRGYREE